MNITLSLFKIDIFILKLIYENYNNGVSIKEIN